MSLRTAGRRVPPFLGATLSAALLLFASGCASYEFDGYGADAETYRPRIERDVMVPMRDGVHLATDIHHPRGLENAPVILVRTPYGKRLEALLDTLRGRITPGEFFSRYGYIVVVQDCRGRYGSGGDYYPFVNEARDGRDTIAWIREQPWFSGRIGTFGSSYLGLTGWLAASESRIDAMHLVTTSPNFKDVLYRGGELQLLTAYFFATLVSDRSMDTAALIKLGSMEENAATLPLSRADDEMSRDIGYFDDILDLGTFAGLCEKLELDTLYGRVESPAILVCGWYDLFLGPQLEDYRRLTAKSPAGGSRPLLLIGPWSHGIEGGDGTVDYGPDADRDVIVGPSHMLAWYDHHLKDRVTGAEAWPGVRIFVMGENVWREEREWPLARTRYTQYFLHSGGHANTRSGDGVLTTSPPGGMEPRDSFIYDPMDPVPTLGGSNLGDNLGAYDQSEVEDREDVLCYTTEVLAGDVEVTGPITAVLYAATDAADTDFTVRLLDVFPNGAAVNIQDGVVRATYRKNDPLNPQPPVPGRVERYEIDLWATSNVFKAGHRIRVEVSSSNFPRFNRNLNTGEPVPDAVRSVVANQTICHEAELPSHVVLPVIPR